MTERTIDLDEVVRILKDKHGISAYVEQTGGGTATIYAGERAGSSAHTTDEQRRLHDERRDWGRGYWSRKCDGACERFPVIAGPGWFEGPGWTSPKASTAEFAIGPDDDGDSQPMFAVEDDCEDDVAREIIRQMRSS